MLCDNVTKFKIERMRVANDFAASLHFTSRDTATLPLQPELVSHILFPFENCVRMKGLRSQYTRVPAAALRPGCPCCSSRGAATPAQENPTLQSSSIHKTSQGKPICQATKRRPDHSSSSTCPAGNLSRSHLNVASVPLSKIL